MSPKEPAYGIHQRCWGPTKWAPDLGIGRSRGGCLTEYEGLDFEEDMVVSEEDYIDLSSRESDSSSRDGFSHFNSIQEGIHVVDIDGETTS